MTKLYQSLDHAYEVIGKYGRYQLFCFLTLQYLCIITASHMTIGFFRLGGLVPDYECKDGDNLFYLTSSQVKKNSSRACEMVKSCKNLEAHNSWVSIYQEFMWVCEPDHIGSTISSLLPIGNIFAHFISGHLSDYFGRKWLFIGGILVRFACSFAEALAPSWQVYMVFNVIAHLVGTITASASFPLLIESVHSKYRIVQGYAFQYSIGFMVAGLLSYLTGNWRTHLFFVTLAGLPCIIFMMLFAESPRFLMQKHKFEEAAKALNRISWFNGNEVRFSAEEMKIMHNVSVNQQSKRKHYSVCHLFSNWKMSSWALSQMCIGITINIIQSVVFFNIQDLSGNPLMNVSIMGAMRLWTPLIAIPLETNFSNFGRKRLTVGSLGLVVICFTTMFTIDFMELNSSARIVGTAAVLCGYVVVTGFVWITYKLYTTELFPTVVRSIALSTFSIASQLGSVIGPQLIYFRKYWHYAPYLGAIFFSSIAVIMATLFLPETKNDPLQDTVHDAKRRKKLLEQDDVNGKLLIKDEVDNNTNKP